MITIYLNGMNGIFCKFPRNIINLGILKHINDEKIIKILEYADDSNIPIKVFPHNRKNVFRDNFISKHLTNNGFINCNEINKEHTCSINGREFRYILKKPNT